MPIPDLPRDWRCPEGWPSPEQAEKMQAERLKWEAIIAATTPRSVPLNIEKDLCDHPERFDYQDVIGKPSAGYAMQIAAIMPGDLKTQLAKVRKT